MSLHASRVGVDVYSSDSEPPRAWRVPETRLVCHLSPVSVHRTEGPTLSGAAPGDLRRQTLTGPRDPAVGPEDPSSVPRLHRAAPAPALCFSLRSSPILDLGQTRARGRPGNGARGGEVGSPPPRLSPGTGSASEPDAGNRRRRGPALPLAGPQPNGPWSCRRPGPSVGAPLPRKNLRTGPSLWFGVNIGCVSCLYYTVHDIT